MADFTIGGNDMGVYEVPVAAGATVTVAAQGKSFNSVTVLVHSGTSPVYVKSGTTVAAKDAASLMIPALTWSSVPLDPSASVSTIAITSAAAAVISVYRS